MRISLLNIVLYGPSAEPRVLSFKEAGLSVITGWSKTGKSSLISIVDYCLGASTCDVPDGPIRRLVKWYAVRLQVGKQQVFVARRAPPAGSQSNSEAYYEIGATVAIPQPARVDVTTTIDAVEQALTMMSGIADYIHEPRIGQTRSPVSVHLRHALFFCFQQQDEIVSRKHLFHRQSEPFVPQTIKDVLPYYLGAVDDDYMIRKGELARLMERLKVVTRSYQELRTLRGEGASRAHGLLAEAADLGLLSLAVAPTALSWTEALEKLRLLATTPLPLMPDPTSTDGEGDVYRQLLESDAALRQRYGRVKQDRDTAEGLLHHHRGYAVEGGHQVARLRSIGVFRSDDVRHTCPLCESDISGRAPTTSHITRAAEQLASQLDGVAASVPHLTRLITKLDEELAQIRQSITDNRQQLDELQRSAQRVQAYRDRIARAAHLQGRVSLYLESVPETSDEPDKLQREMDALGRQIKALQEQLDPDAIEERLDSFLALLSSDITESGRRLQLEHAEKRLRLDRRRSILVADTPDGPVPMERIGSGANWVGYHIIVHLALHRWFTVKQRPVPGFLFLDQPSQIGFPADTVEKREEDADREAVRRMMLLILEASNSEDAPFQVIVTEHADIDEPWFQERIVEVWRDGEALIPRAWLSSVGENSPN